MPKLSGKMAAICLLFCAVGLGLIYTSGKFGIRQYLTGGTFEACPVANNIPALAQPSSVISLVDASDLMGEQILSKTFSLAVSDISGDGVDDFLIGAHEYNPYFYVSEQGVFKNRSELLFPVWQTVDRHGHTIADLDNDNDLDIAIAGGGTGGVGKGVPNIILLNTAEDGDLSFRRAEIDASLALSAGRSRSLIPIASADGRAVDLYYTALLREGFPNMMLRNLGATNTLGFERDSEHFLSEPINDHGRGVVADFDGDGRGDYLVVEGPTARLLWHPESGRASKVLAHNAYSVKAADFNNDGMLDIFIGRGTPSTQSDRVTASGTELIYVIHENGWRDKSSIAFSTAGDTLALRLSQHVPLANRKRLHGAGDIFLGKQLANPQSRNFVTNRSQAAGKPAEFAEAGIYIWYSIESDEWNISWRFHSFLDVFKGVVRAEGISGLRTTGFFEKEPADIDDIILTNEGKGKFSRLCTAGLTHRTRTVATTVVDFNNDGWLDIMGVRHGEQGMPNGRPFILSSHKGQAFSLEELPIRPQDLLHRADLIAHGFFNEDNQPDVIITNGYGQIPGTWGSPQLMLNNTDSLDQAILVLLEGAVSNRFGVGAAMTLFDAAGRIVGYRVQGLNTNISQDSQWQHFGLGSTRPPYTLKVQWPDDTMASYEIPGFGRYLFKQ